MSQIRAESFLLKCGFRQDIDVFAHRRLAAETRLADGEFVQVTENTSSWNDEEELAEHQSYRKEKGDILNENKEKWNTMHEEEFFCRAALEF
jgi:hypothetical protein